MCIYTFISSEAVLEEELSETNTEISLTVDFICKITREMKIIDSELHKNQNKNRNQIY